MRVINPNVELLKQMPGIDGIYKQIELAGRTCYKSEDKITETSAKEFVERMINSGHTAMLEHGTVYLYLEVNSVNANNHTDDQNLLWKEFANKIYNKYAENKYSKAFITFIDSAIGFKAFGFRISREQIYITTNYRVLVENNWLDDLYYISEPTEFHERRITLKFTTNIGVTREGNRHRVNSIAEESTRYCDYTKEKHGNGETNIVPPVWFEDVDNIVLKETTKMDWLETIYNITTNEMDDVHSPFSGVDYYGAAIVFCNICYNIFSFS